MKKHLVVNYCRALFILLAYAKYFDLDIVYQIKFFKTILKLPNEL